MIMGRGWNRVRGTPPGVQSWEATPYDTTRRSNRPNPLPYLFYAKRIKENPKLNAAVKAKRLPLYIASTSRGSLLTAIS